MSWALPYIPKLQAGETVQFRPRGHSMTGRVASGQLVTVAPCTIEELRKGDIVLCKVQGTIYLHLVSAIGQDGRVQISNNHNHVNGWTKTIYGRCIAVED